VGDICCRIKGEAFGGRFWVVSIDLEPNASPARSWRNEEYPKEKVDKTVIRSIEAHH
jgi:hypothetical protein